MHTAVQRLCPSRGAVTAWLRGIGTLPATPPADAIPDAPLGINLHHDDKALDVIRHDSQLKGHCLISAAPILKTLSLTRLQDLYLTHQHQQPHQQLQLVRLKHTQSAARGGALSQVRAAGGAGPRAGGQGAAARRPAWLRYQPSTRISDTATLQELVALAAAEAPRWNAKELAAAAMRGVSLWRREGGAGGGHGGRGRWRRPLAVEPDLRVADRGGGAESSEVARNSQAVAAGGDLAAGGAAPRTVKRAEGAVVVARTRGVHVSGWGGVLAAYGAMVVVLESRRPLSERRLADLLDRLMRTATARLSQDLLGPRELSTLLLSASRVGWWRPGSLQLLSAFLDFGGERLRRAEALDVVMVLKVLAAARQVAATGSEIAVRVADLTPAAATAAAAALPRYLPSCSPWTLAELLCSCGQLVHVRQQSPALRGGSPPGGPDSTTPSATCSAAAGLGTAAAVGHSALTALAAQVAGECMRRRFAGFTAQGVVGAAKSLSLFARRAPNGPHGSRKEGKGGTATGASNSAGANGVEVFEEALRALVAVAAVPSSPQMAGASSAQWRQLLGAAKAAGGVSPELEAAAAAATTPPA